MKWVNWFFIVTAFFGLLANLLAILDFLSGDGILRGWRLDPGLVAVVTFVLMTYTLVVWSWFTWRWAQRNEAAQPTQAPRSVSLLANGLLAFPLLVFWLYLLFSLVLYRQVAPSERWLLALAHAWIVTPFVTLGLTMVGEILGPLMGAGRKPQAD